MNTGYVLRNLHEGAEQLQRAIAAASSEDFGAFMVSMGFMYRKLNLAWNSRDLTNEQLLSRADEQYEVDCRFPTDLSFQISD